MNIMQKIFSDLRTSKGRCIKLFCFKLFEEFNNESFRLQKFCSGFITTKKIFSPARERKVLKILNIPISERIIANDKLQYKIFNCPIKKINLPDIFYKKYLKDVQYEYDDVYILHANSGETYLFFAYFAKTLLNKNNSQKPLFIATQNYHVDILKMYLPNANVIYLKNFYTKTKSDKWLVNGHNCYMIFSRVHFSNIEKSICKKEIGQVHYLNAINKTLEISEKDYTKPIVTISQETKQSLHEKIALIGLDLDNFVIISPEAQTCENIPITFWNKIVKEFKSRGFNVFLNIVHQENYIEGCKTTYLNYQEVFELATKAKGIVSLRSGLTEFLLPANTVNITIYTKFRNRKRFASSIAKTMSAFSMKKFPFVNNELICELNIDDFENEQKLLSAVLENFDSRVMRKG